MAKKELDLPLRVEIVGDRVVIDIGIDTLMFAIQHGDGWDPGIKITDKVEFAKEIVRELNREDEEGTTAVHILLDTAAEAALENGAEGVEFPND